MPHTPERYEIPTPINPTATAARAVFLYPYFLRIKPAGRPMKA
ncbi:hypothetical protein EVA_15174 [gut metagenome]|uniref:Uncharacterized protein n=1 Tax=gut metagenome TaxID=749906 RepID=J9G4H7_9ZZZZ